MQQYDTIPVDAKLHKKLNWKLEEVSRGGASQKSTSIKSMLSVAGAGSPLMNRCESSMESELLP